MISDTLKWVLAGSFGFAAFYVLAIQTHQQQLDSEQSIQIREVERDWRSYAQKGEEAFRDLAKSQASTARILEGVATRIEAIDTRGSRALREHEGSKHQE